MDLFHKFFNTRQQLQIKIFQTTNNLEGQKLN